MFGSVAPYFVALFAMAFAACSALALTYVVGHLD